MPKQKDVVEVYRSFWIHFLARPFSYVALALSSIRSTFYGFVMVQCFTYYTNSVLRTELCVISYQLQENNADVRYFQANSWDFPNLPWRHGLPALKAVSLTAICEPTV
jgi:hypothetical protein